MNESDIPFEGKFADYEYSIEQKTVSFQQVFEAYLYKNEDLNKNSESRLAYQKYFPELLHIFQRKHGAIKECYYDSQARAGAVLTEKDDFYFELYELYDETLENMGIRELLNQCSWLHIECLELPRGKDRRVLTEKIYDICTDLLSLIDTRKRVNTNEHCAGGVESILAMSREELKRTQERYKLSAQRQAQFNYFMGMLIGIAVVLMSAMADWRKFVKPDLIKSDNATFSFEVLSMCLLFGGVGAVVSVMSRMTLDGLILDIRVGFIQLVLLGVFRPIIGAVFGVVLYLIIASKLLPIEVTSTKEQLFFAALAFLAGFSERWAQDMFALTESRLTGTRKNAQHSESVQTKP
jgi:hypothetical protein